jgi:hypothetical protein
VAPPAAKTFELTVQVPVPDMANPAEGTVWPEVEERIVDLIDAGRVESDDPDSVPRDIATGAFGSVYEFLVKQFHDGADISRLERYVPDLMYLAVSPYVGHDRAREELLIPPPPAGESFE